MLQCKATIFSYVRPKRMLLTCLCKPFSARDAALHILIGIHQYDAQPDWKFLLGSFRPGQSDDSHASCRPSYLVETSASDCSLDLNFDLYLDMEKAFYQSLGSVLECRGYLDAANLSPHCMKRQSQSFQGASRGRVPLA